MNKQTAPKYNLIIRTIIIVLMYSLLISNTAWSSSNWGEHNMLNFSNLSPQLSIPSEYLRKFFSTFHRAHSKKGTKITSIVPISSSSIQNPYYVSADTADRKFYRDNASQIINESFYASLEDAVKTSLISGVDFFRVEEGQRTVSFNAHNDITGKTAFKVIIRRDLQNNLRVDEIEFSHNNSTICFSHVMNASPVFASVEDITEDPLSPILEIIDLQLKIYQKDRAPYVLSGERGIRMIKALSNFTYEDGELIVTTLRNGRITWRLANVVQIKEFYQLVQAQIRDEPGNTPLKRLCEEFETAYEAQLYGPGLRQTFGPVIQQIHNQVFVNQAI